jgi:hypothetical protein
MRTWVSLFLLVLIVAGCLPGQTFYGSVVGSVTDASGSAVPEASVVLINAGTSERRTMQTGSDGSYRFVNLQPGRYRLEVERSGFKRVVRENIVVEVESTVRIDVALAVGDVSQTVEVTAQTPLLQTENASLGQVVEARKVLEMPLNGRNPFGLVALVPGVVPGGQSGTTPTGTNPFAWGNFQIGGGQSNQSASYIDGAPINASYINLTALVPTQDAIQEFRVQTNNLGPEFGRLAGGAVNLTTKSGTNEFHGSVYEFFRNRSLNANTFFNNAFNVRRPAFSQNQYGGNAGGPVIRDKTFFFGSWEGFRLRQGASYTFSVPTDAMRDGDFSNVRNASGALVPIHDPLTTCGRFGNAPCDRNAAGAEIITRQTFPGNRIPATRIDPASKFMTQYWARANGPGNQFTAVNNYTANASVGGDNDQINGRVDHTFSQNHRLFGRYTWWKNLNLPIDPYNTKTCVDRCTEKFTTNQAVIADTFSFSPTTVMDVRLSYLRFKYDRTSLTEGFDLTQLGWPSFMNNQVVFRVLPNVNVTGFNGVWGTSGTGSTIVARNDVYSLAPTLTKIAGSHTFKFGGEFRRNTHNYYQQNNPSGTFNFDPLMTASAPAGGSGGNGFASFLLGYGTGGGVNQNALVASHLMYYAGFASDQWLVSPKLTLNYGVRFEQMGPWSERFDRLTVLLPYAPDAELSRIAGRQLFGKIALVDTPDAPSRNTTKKGNLWAPRLGLAYRVNEKTVLRTGYGIFWLPNDVRWNMAPNNDFVNSFNNPFNGTLDGSLTPNDTFRNPFPNGLLPVPGRTPDLMGLSRGQGIFGTLFDDPFSYAQQWNFEVGRELPGATALSVAYAGSKGTHLPGADQQFNQISPEFFSLGNSVLQEQVPNPYFGQVKLGALAQPRVARGQLLRPYPQYTGVAGRNATNRSSIYHSAQVKLEKRFQRGGTILGAYTWARLISDTDTLTGWLEPGGGGGGAQNWYDLRAERSLTLYDVPHRLVVSYIVDLPFGKGQPLASGVTGFAEKLISGWGVNGVSTFQSGFPLPNSVAVNQNGFGAGQRPNRTGQSGRIEGPAQQRLSRWFDTTTFTHPGPWAFGNSARTLPDIRSHGIANYDFTVFKNTQITERFGLQFRTEIFNLFNRVQFGYPGTALGVPQFGVVSGQYNNPRLVQMALRLSF